MKTSTLLTFTIAVVLLTGCSDQLAGPALDTETLSKEEITASKGASGDLADLSLSMTVDQATPFPPDTLVGLTIELHNAGPDEATGVRVAF